MRVFDVQPNPGLLEYKIDRGKVYVEQGAFAESRRTGLFLFHRSQFIKNVVLYCPFLYLCTNINESKRRR